MSTEYERLDTALRAYYLESTGGGKHSSNHSKHQHGEHSKYGGDEYDEEDYGEDYDGGADDFSYFSDGDADIDNVSDDDIFGDDNIVGGYIVGGADDREDAFDAFDEVDDEVDSGIIGGRSSQRKPRKASRVDTSKYKSGKAEANVANVTADEVISFVVDYIKGIKNSGL